LHSHPTHSTLHSFPTRRSSDLYILADPHEAWVLETAGRYWAAKRIKNGVYSISNIYSIERDWDEAHPKLVEHAIQMGWSKSAKRSEEHTSELQSRFDLVCRLLL